MELYCIIRGKKSPVFTGLLRVYKSGKGQVIMDNIFNISSLNEAQKERLIYKIVARTLRRKQNANHVNVK